MYYGLIRGREDCPVQYKLGHNWNQAQRIDFIKMMEVIRQQLQLDLDHRGLNQTSIQIVKVIAYIENTASQSTIVDNHRAQLIRDLQESYFEVQISGFTDRTKYLEVQLLADMMHNGYTDAYDVIKCTCSLQYNAETTRWSA